MRLSMKRIFRGVMPLLVSFALCICFYARPVMAAQSEGEGVRVPIIMYHSIHNSAADMWTLPIANFEEDLRYLAENDYHTVTISDLAAYVYDGGTLPEKPVVLSFDDGYYNNYSQVLPLMEKYDMSMVLSVIGEHTDTWSKEPGTDEKDGHCTWEHLREMVATGRVELSNHTQALHSNTDGRHGCVRMAGEDLDAYSRIFSADIEQLQQKIEGNCGVRPVCFAYPFGSSCVEASDALKEMGFLATLSCYEGMNVIRRDDPDCLFDLHRCNRTNSDPVWEILERVE
jgi:peptidoglycan/xylan/chitin deacetylase (PgdA/CDA1 family)